MMWLNDQQYQEIVELTADWTMDQLVALTSYLASATNHSWSKVLDMVENIALI